MMKIHPSFAIVFTATCLLSTYATAQTVHKCGNSYSQTPCPDGIAIDTADQRTAAQKAQTDLAARRDGEVAAAMEKARLEREKKDRSAKVLAPRKATVVRVTEVAAKHVIKKKKKKEPAYFTARVPGQKASRPASKKSKSKDDSSKS